MIKTIEYLHKLYRDAVDNGIPVSDIISGWLANVAGIAAVVLIVVRGGLK